MRSDRRSWRARARGRQLHWRRVGDRLCARQPSPGPYRDALELANQAKFTRAELDAYEKVRDEIRQVLEIAAARWTEGREKGRAEGLEKGRAEGRLEGELRARRDTLLRILARSGIVLMDDDRARIDACIDVATLDLWIDNALGAKDTAGVFV